MILVTGGAGYIGSHTCAALAAAGQPFLILDNFSNARRSVLDRLAQVLGFAPTCIEGDIRDAALLARIFAEHPIDAVVHFAALKVVNDSVHMPLAYYDNNVAGTVTLLRAMQAAGVRTLVFSSTAAVYGVAQQQPVQEDFPLSTANPYGRSKLMMEDILADVERSEPGQWRIARLRYFNPVGAHESGLIGEDPQGVPSNLMPFISQVAAGLRPQLSVYGGDYPTPDGTGVRDFIHVMDLAQAHVAALGYLRQHLGLLTVNVGTGQPHSVLELVRGFEQATGQKVPYQVVPRRPMDVAECWADPSRAQQLLGWRAQRDLARMCADTWRWQNGVARTLS